MSANEIKTRRIDACEIRRGDKVVDGGPHDTTRVREVEKVSAHLGGRELAIEFKDRRVLITRPDLPLDVDEENRLARTDAYAGYSKVAPDADEIGAGDDVVILDGEGGISEEGVLCDVQDERATVNTGREWVTVPLGAVAHPDSAQAEACAMFGGADDAGHIADRQSARREGYDWN
jgi:hypothetical protein